MSAITAAARRPAKGAHTPLIRLAAARRAYEAACERCPHWDFSDGGADHDCCIELYEAERELRAARKAVRP